LGLNILCLINRDVKQKYTNLISKTKETIEPQGTANADFISSKKQRIMTQGANVLLLWQHRLGKRQDKHN